MKVIQMYVSEKMFSISLAIFGSQYTTYIRRRPTIRYLAAVPLAYDTMLYGMLAYVLMLRGIVCVRHGKMSKNAKYTRNVLLQSKRRIRNVVKKCW